MEKSLFFFILFYYFIFFLQNLERLIPKNENGNPKKSAIKIKESLFELSSELISLENEEILIDKPAFLNFFNKCEYFRLFANIISSSKHTKKDKKPKVVIPRLNFQVFIDLKFFHK